MKKSTYSRIRNRQNARQREAGFSLTLALIIIVLATIVVVAFLTTTSTERTTAGAYARAEKARQIAEAGVDAAIARLVTEMKYRPYHAIGYRSLPVGTSSKPLTEIVPIITGPRTTDPTIPTYNSSPVTTSDVYLVSVTSTTPTGPPGSLPPTSLDDTNSIDLNNNHVSSEPKGWIGSPVTAGATPIPFRAPWVNVLRDPSQPEQHANPNAADYNPVVARYAYWVEDETSKLDISTAGNQENGGGFQRGDGVDLPDKVPQPKWARSDLDIGALPLLAGTPSTSLTPGDIPTNQAIMNLRASLPMLDARYLNRAGGKLAPDVHETIKFYATAFSLSDDLAGNGRRRANLNALVASPSPTPVPTDVVAGNIDDIAYVISGTHLIPTAGPGLGPSPNPDNRVYKAAANNYTNTLTTFGQRFWTASPAPNADQQKMYLERIAANIRDYIDTDSLATYIDTSDKVVSGSKPTLSWRSGTEPRAVGKEAIPFLQELAWYGYERQMATDPSSPTARNYDVDIDFYFEFMNPTTKDFVAPAGAFLKVYSRVPWSAGTYPPLQPPDTEFPIAGFTFPAGKATVLTTAPTAQDDPPGLILSGGAPVIRLSGGTRNFKGKTDEKIGANVGLQMKGRAGSSGTTDYTTEAVWGTPTGIYEALGYVASGGSGTLTFNFVGNNIGSKTRFVYSYSLRGNDEKSRTGDARSLSEQLSMSGGLASLGTDQTRFFGDIAGDGIIPKNSTFSKSKISYVDSTKWPDYSPAFADDAATGYAVNRDNAIQSIGELGNIYDPIRDKATTTGSGGPPPSILQARGGGRTLKVGQSDDLAGVRFSSTWFNSAWRLTDLFSADPSRDGTNAYVKVSNPTSRGKINVNGVLRDDGVAFRAALRSFAFSLSPDSDPQLNGVSLVDPEIDTLVSAIKNYLTTNGPMMERGELSQVSFFNTGTIAGKSLANANDRGREELFRRTVELATTRSASFTVYSAGEMVRQDTSGKVTTVGQKRLAVTFQLEPRRGNLSLQSSTTWDDFADGYAVKRIYAPN